MSGRLFALDHSQMSMCYMNEVYACEPGYLLEKGMHVEQTRSEVNTGHMLVKFVCDG